jgi:hypothetical protein
MPLTKSVSAYPVQKASTANSMRPTASPVPPMSSGVANKDPYRDPAWEWIKKAVPLIGATIQATTGAVRDAFASPMPMPPTKPGVDETEEMQKLYEFLFQKPAPSWLANPPRVNIPYISEALSGRK